MEPPNQISDFDPAVFAIHGFCNSCGHTRQVDHAELDMIVPRLIASLRCRECGSRGCSIRIVYTGSGSFHYR